MTLGEVINLENDYHPNVRCTCKSTLGQCPHWNSVLKASAEVEEADRLHLDQKAKRSALDSKGITFKKMLSVLGFRTSWLYGRRVSSTYLRKNAGFFGLVARCFPQSSYLLDLSKPPERMELLLKAEGIDIYCIHLKRDLRTLLSSNLSRQKKTRSGFGNKLIRETLLLNLRERHRRRIFKRVAQDRRITVDFDRFKQDPEKELRPVLEWLGIPSDGLDLHDRSINITEQHLYVGNRWLFSDPELKQVHISNSPSEADLTSSQQRVFNFFHWLINGSHHE